MGNKIIDIYSDQENRASSLEVNQGYLRVVGNLRHSYCFRPRNKKHALELIQWLEQWVHDSVGHAVTSLEKFDQALLRGDFEGEGPFAHNIFIGLFGAYQQAAGIAFLALPECNKEMRDWIYALVTDFDKTQTRQRVK